MYLSSLKGNAGKRPRDGAFRCRALLLTAPEIAAAVEGKRWDDKLRDQNFLVLSSVAMPYCRPERTPSTPMWLGGRNGCRLFFGKFVYGPRGCTSRQATLDPLRGNTPARLPGSLRAAPALGGGQRPHQPIFPSLLPRLDRFAFGWDADPLPRAGRRMSGPQRPAALISLSIRAIKPYSPLLGVT